MRFGPRNAYYLRISESTALPLYLYLDERHIDWMSERVLQHVLEDLRPRILPKLKEEADAHLGPAGPANAKRGSVDVHRGDSYQFGYFLRKTDPHAVSIKTRNFVPAPERPQEVLPPPKLPSPQSATHKGKKRATKAKKAPAVKSKKPKTKGKQRAIETEEEEAAISISSDEDEDVLPSAVSAPARPRRSSRARKVVAGGYREQGDDIEFTDQDPDPLNVEADVEMTEPAQTTADISALSTEGPPLVGASLLDDSNLIAIDADDTASIAVKREDAEPTISVPDIPPEIQVALPTSASAGLPASEVEEDKTKLSLQLRYRGFNIHGRCLCVIVEPYPPIRSMSRAPSRAPSMAPTAGSLISRAPSIAPPDFVPSTAAQRGRTPLFLPEYDRERSVTPASARGRILPPVPLFNESIAGAGGDSDSDDEGMMTFSQLLSSVGQHRAGIAEDDDEIDGAVFFGDADETREL